MYCTHDTSGYWTEAMKTGYQVETRAVDGGRAFTVTVSTRPGERDVVTDWWNRPASYASGAELTVDDLATEVLNHGWTLSSKPVVGIESTTAAVTPSDWRRLLVEATQARQAAAEQAARIERAWQRLIGDTPRGEVPITEIAGLVGLTRGRVHNIRREQNIGKMP